MVRGERGLGPRNERYGAAYEEHEGSEQWRLLELGVRDPLPTSNLVYRQ